MPSWYCRHPASAVYSIFIWITLLHPQSHLKITDALFGMQRLSCGTNFLIFSASYQSVTHIALLRSYALILNLLCTCLAISSIFVLKLTSSPSLFFFSVDWSGVISISWCLEVFGGGSIGKCGRIREPSWLFVTLTYLRTYLLTYLVHWFTFREERESGSNSFS